MLGATLGTSLPGEDHPPRTIQVEGISPPFEGATGHSVRVAWVEPNYFELFGAPVRVGRAFDAGDMAQSEARVAIANDAFVLRALASGEPIGRRIRLAPRGGRPSGQWIEIVGVVRDVVVDLTTPVGLLPALYFPLVTDAGGTRLAVHVPEGPSQFAGRLRAIVGAVDPALMLLRLGTLEELAGISFLQLLGLAIGLLVFAALLLSTTGIYALMSFTVTQRTREIGIRTALGANPRRVVSEIFWRAIGQLAVGTVLGLGIGFVVTRGTVFEQGPGPIVGITALILIMGLIACGRPMSRALRIQPTEALREGG